MKEYEIFDLSLPDEYIMALDREDLLVLLAESSEAWDDMEAELDELMWSDSPRRRGFLAFVPTVPSEYTYHQSLYVEQINSDPSFAVKLGKAQNLAALAGACRAIRETTLMALEGTN